MHQPQEPIAPPLTARHLPWERELKWSGMRGLVAGQRIEVNNRYLVRNGDPIIPVSGELHYSRVRSDRWEERLRLMKAGGVTVVAFYVIWIHHEPREGEYRFDGDYDLRVFVETCQRLGLDVVLRLGPWIHGEVRNGGFPDWVQNSGFDLRTNDARYLELVARWFRRVASELAPLVGGQGPVLAIQLENELYDQPDHIVTLKAIARDAGMDAPVWTATGWGGAVLPRDEVLPLFGGYADGFWVEAASGWDNSFREHFYFSHVWDDPGIGADIRFGAAAIDRTPPPRSATDVFPPATCELGGGMARAYHRRPVIEGLDVATIALTKIGNGSAWQGFYMYAGGSNPRPDLQESHVTDYPNDMPTFDYDFNAPVGATGRLRVSHALLRRQHAFLAEFGARVAPMPSTLPDALPLGFDDDETLRWAIRSDGSSAFVFVTRHQPYDGLAASRAHRFSAELDGDVVTFPESPISVPPGTLAHWPLNLGVGDVRIRWATASAVTILRGGAHPILVLAASEGIVPRLQVRAGVVIVTDGGHGVEVDGDVVAFDPSATQHIEVRGRDTTLGILVLSAADAESAWVLDHAGHRQLVLAEGAVWLDDEGLLAGRTENEDHIVRRFDATRRSFIDVETAFARPPWSVDLALPPLQSAGNVPAEYGAREGRADEPSSHVRRELGEVITLPIPALAADADPELEVEWAGDVLELLVDGEPVADQFWAGEAFVANLRDVRAERSRTVALRILPLHPEAPVGLSLAAQERRRSSVGALHELSSVRLVERAAWREVPGE